MAWWDVFTHGMDDATRAIGHGLEDAGKAVVDTAKKIVDPVTGIVTGDTFYPDNPDRRKRAEELASDCADLGAALALKTAEIDGVLKVINAKLAATFKEAAERPDDPFKVVNLAVSEKVYEVQTLLMPLVSSDAVGPALLIGTTALLTKEGLLPSGVLEAALAVSGLYTINLMLEGGPGAFALVIGLGALNAGELRSTLQTAIHRGFAARTKLAHGLVVNAKVSECLVGIANAVQALIDAGSNEQAVVDKMNEIATTQLLAIQQLSDADTALLLLTPRDKLRNSWTKEDS